MFIHLATVFTVIMLIGTLPILAGSLLLLVLDSYSDTHSCHVAFTATRLFFCQACARCRRFLAAPLLLGLYLLWPSK